MKITKEITINISLDELKKILNTHFKKEKEIEITDISFIEETDSMDDDSVLELKGFDYTNNYPSMITHNQPSY